jgi:hypothetical protein
MLKAQSSMRNGLTVIFTALTLFISAQINPSSIQYEQNEYFKQFGAREAGFYDSLNGFAGKLAIRQSADCQLQRIVFGFHPYWAGSDYLNYQWNLLSDLCYFSYEVDPSTGEAVTIHDWLTDPAIDSAMAHGVKVHLCATIFSGHSVFFHNLSARQNLINNLISLVQQRNAGGINMDIEAMPSSLGDSVTAFMRELSVQLKATLPAAGLSIDLPAMDWGNDFQIDSLSNWVDWYFIMGYDYYWNGSSQAGPVSPLYSLTPGYDFSLSRTVSAYETAGMDPGKMILGVPYYGRQWKTSSNTIPSGTLASGIALTYANIRSNSGNYNPLTYYWEPNSFSSCYIFYQNSNWNQCFIGLDHDLRKKYDIINYRDLAGIGIWALGYDDGYTELWQAISDKFSDCYIPSVFDTLYDSGGPAWHYYTDEAYSLTIDHGFNDSRYLEFLDFNLEEGFDSLWLYAGPDTTFPFLGGFSGSANPGSFSSVNGAFTLRFNSDPMMNAPGWTAVYHDGSLGTGNISLENEELQVYPNPADDYINVSLPSGNDFDKLLVIDFSGRIFIRLELAGNPDPDKIQIVTTDWPAGIYIIILSNCRGEYNSIRFIKTR